MIEYKDVTYSYNEDGMALQGVNLSVQKGEFVAVIGHNGSGKSTMAKLANALYIPTSGTVNVAGMDTSVRENVLKIRQMAGMVFQNPDNQMVTTIVEEDVAFGPENLGVEPQKIRERVDEALAFVNMTKFAGSAPNTLSGGQKQRIAIAGILAMRPDIIILDEPTAMLDPKGRKDVFETVARLNKEEGKTVLFITHFMEEAARADRIVVVSDGQVVLSGTPSEIFEHYDELVELGLDVPFPVRLAHELRAKGVPVQDSITEKEMVAELCRLFSKN